MSMLKNNEQKENESKNNWFVYMHKNKINNKKYFGITSRKPNVRWGKNGNKYKSSPYFYNAIQKYGWDNFEHIILFTELDEETAKSKEKELIKLFQSNNRMYGYNCTEGGDGVCGRKMTNEQIEKMRKRLIGRKHTEEWKQEMKKIMTGRKLSNEWKNKISESHIGSLNPSARKIVLIDNKYNLIKTYDCMKYASEELNVHITHIQDVCDKKYTNTGGHIFMYYEEYEQNKDKLIGKEIHIKPYRRKINQITLDGTFINTYESIKDAERITGINCNNICSVLKGKTKSAGGFKWEYAI